MPDTQAEPAPTLQDYMYFRAMFFFFILMTTANSSIVLGGGNATPFEKGLLFIAGIVFLIERPLYKELFWALITIIFVAITCFLMSDFPHLSADRFLRSLFSLTATLVIMMGEPTQRDREFVLKVVAIAPLLVTGFGLIYSVIGIRPLFYTDFLGASRLQGALNPSGLGSISYIGTVAAMLGAGILKKNGYLLLAGVNLLILLLSAARMPLGLTIILCAVIYIFLVARQKITGLVTVAIMALPLVGLAILFGDSIMKRFESNSLSGRDIIWAALRQVSDQYPWFGVGLGHQILIIPEEVTQRAATIAAHDEYLRLTVETGYVGAFAIYGCLIFMMVRLWALPRVGYSFVFLMMTVSFFVYCRTDNAISSSNIPLMLVMASFAFAQARHVETRQAQRIATRQRIFGADPSPLHAPVAPAHGA